MLMFLECTHVSKHTVSWLWLAVGSSDQISHDDNLKVVFPLRGSHRRHVWETQGQGKYLERGFLHQKALQEIKTGSGNRSLSWKKKL